MYNFEQPVIMKVCIKHLKSPTILYMLAPDSTSRPSAGLRAPAAAGADPAGRQLLGQNSEGIPANETHAGPQSDHGGAAEVPTMPHWRQAVGHVGVWLELCVHLDFICRVFCSRTARKSCALLKKTWNYTSKLQTLHINTELEWYQKFWNGNQGPELKLTWTRERNMAASMSDC